MASGWPPSEWRGRLGCRVVGVASSADKRQAALDAGAEAALDPAAEPIKDAARGLGRRYRCRPRRGSHRWRAGRAGATGARGPGAVSRHRVCVGRHPVRAAQPDPAAQPVRHRHRLGNLGHDASDRTACDCWRTCWPWWRRERSTRSVPPNTRSTTWLERSRTYWGDAPWGRSRWFLSARSATLVAAPPLRNCDVEGEAEVLVLDREGVVPRRHPVRAVRLGLVPRAGARHGGARRQLREAECRAIHDLRAGPDVVMVRVLVSRSRRSRRGRPSGRWTSGRAPRRRTGRCSCTRSSRRYAR